MTRVCIFVDGENFRHSICDSFTFNEFEPGEYLPKKAQWSAFFDWLVEEVCGDNSQRLRTYWYVLEHVDFFPYKFPNAQKEPDSLKILLSKDKKLRAEIAKLDKDKLAPWMVEIAGALKNKKNSFQSRFTGWRVLQDGIANKHRAVEFRRDGAIRYNLFTGRMGEEKAVDVNLATDLITLREIYDVAILVSGDQDYVPAVRCVKNFGKTVVNVAFVTREGKILPGGARRLNNVTDSSYEISFADLKRFLLPDIVR